MCSNDVGRVLYTQVVLTRLLQSPINLNRGCLEQTVKSLSKPAVSVGLIILYVAVVMLKEPMYGDKLAR